VPLSGRRAPRSLLVALVLYLALAATTVRAVGVVGEVDLSWALGRPPAALVQLDPPLWADGATPPTAGSRLGPLVASQVRPVEGLRLGPVALPLAVNSYTGGLADWPARAVWLLTGSRRAVIALHVALGAVLLVLLHRFLRFRGTDVAAAVAALVLASDWSFLFYRKVLGGTEILLLAAGLLCLWALWSRRWSGGRHGLLALGVGIGLGFQAKLTFSLSLVALLATALLMRWDKPQLSAPRRGGALDGLLAAVLLTSPLWIAALHHGLALPEHVPSHDFPATQGRRVLSALSGGPGPAREGLANLWFYLARPLAFFGPAYGVTELPGPSPWRLSGCLLVLAGVGLGWKDRHPTPQDALLRFTSVYLLLQLGLLWLVARDLHHMAQATPTFAIVAGLALDRLAGVATPPRSPRRALVALLLSLPLVIGGISALARTDEVVRRVPVPTFPERGQADLVSLLRGAGVRRLVLADYESYGMLELLVPEIRVEHAWPAVARQGPGALPQVLERAQGAWFLELHASQPMGYNLRPSARQLQAAADQAGLVLTRVGALPGDAAVLYRVDRADGLRPG